MAKGFDDKIKVPPRQPGAPKGKGNPNKNRAKKKRLTSGLRRPGKFIKPSKTQNIKPQDNQFLNEDTGQIDDISTTDIKKVDPTGQNVESTATVDQPEEFDAATYDAAQVGDQVEDLTEGMQAATAQPTEKATVQGQLEELYKDFEDGTPPWASGAMRAATAAMQARGLGASSMAGQAIVQAAMESATAIASQDAATFARFEEINLNNEQQSMVLKSQMRLQGLFSDQAAENASKQFNASSENQVNEFLTSMRQRALEFNAAQINSMRTFNATLTSERELSNVAREDARYQFNKTLKDSRDKFNAQNNLIIAQANAQWRQQIATANTAAKNAANMQRAKDMAGLSTVVLDNMWQRERDILQHAFVKGENASDRALEIALQKMKIDANEDAAKAERKAQSNAAVGSFFAKVVGGILDI